MARITIKDIEKLLKWINANSKNTYTIDRAYGGYMLLELMNESGGCRQVSARVEGRQLYNILSALQSYIIFERYDGLFKES